MIYNSVIEAIGNTPLIKLKNISSNLKCDLFAKCEFFNPGGSIKDRIAIKMIEEAEKDKIIKPGDTLIEPTSGNTGIGLAMAGAVKGYQVIITMPEKMSQEKQVVIEALGAKIIRTPTDVAWDHPESHIEVAKKLAEEMSNTYILDQYSNLNNPRVHYETTGEEILRDLEGRVDMVIVGAGTGGTISGVAKKIKEQNPKCIVVGVDPIGSILAGPGDVCSYKVEGIGYDFVPSVLDYKNIDKWVKVADKEAFLLARQVIRLEGLLCGGSSGAALYAALKEAASLSVGQRCVVILPDGIRNYMSKFVNDEWMKNNSFSSSFNSTKKVKDYLSNMSKNKLYSVSIKTHIKQAIEIMKQKGYSQLLVMDNNKFIGMLREKDLLDCLICGHSLDTEISFAMSLDFVSVPVSAPIDTVKKILNHSDSVIVVDDNKKPINIITKIDLVDWMLSDKFI
jgi:cystathionine beta-synthase